MNTINLITATIILMIVSIIVNASPDTTKINLGTKILLIVDNNDTIVDIDETDTVDVCKKRKFNGHWAGIELGLNNYLNSSNSMTLNQNEDFMKLNMGKSWEFSLNFAEFNLGLYKDYIGLTTGFGLRFNNYRFDNNINLFRGTNTILYEIDTVRTFTKNKLTTSYLMMPLLVEFQIPTSAKKRISVTAGGYAGVKIGSHVKQKYEIAGVNYKDKNRDSYYLNPIKYGLTARLGFEDIQFFANYDLSTLFEKNKGPELYPLSFGITLLNL